MHLFNHCCMRYISFSNISKNSFISLNVSYMYSAVVECYETLKDIIYNLLQDEEDKMFVSHICDKVEWSIQEHTFVKEFKMSGLPSLSEKLEKFLTLFVTLSSQNISVSYIDPLTVKESAINVPQNLDARRRITFFANSLFMNMLKAPKVRNILSFNILTPYYKEDVRYSIEELNKENEDGISILFYLRKIYLEWIIPRAAAYRKLLLMCILGPAQNEVIAELRNAFLEIVKEYKVVAAGGLHVVGTERHKSQRIDNQLRGRSGRQGDPGGSRFFLSLEDNIFRIFGRDQIQLFEYDEVLNSQRDRVYTERRRALESENLQSLLIEYAKLTMDDIIE
ncbi:hypothetical protein S245_070075, partial [Arachis hypogaea]